MTAARSEIAPNEVRGKKDVGQSYEWGHWDKSHTNQSGNSVKCPDSDGAQQVTIDEIEALFESVAEWVATNQRLNTEEVSE